MAKFDCTITDRPATDGYTTRRFEFKPALLPTAQRVEELSKKMPGVSPLSYLLGYLVAGLTGELRRLNLDLWMIDGVESILERRGDAFALRGLEVTFSLHEESENRALNVVVVRTAAVWAGIMLNPVDLLHLTAPRLTE